MGGGGGGLPCKCGRDACMKISFQPLIEGRPIWQSGHVFGLRKNLWGYNNPKHSDSGERCKLGKASEKMRADSSRRIVWMMTDASTGYPA